MIFLAAGVGLWLVSQTPAQGAPDIDLLTSAKFGQAADVKDLLSRGAAVDTADRRGFTPLMWACASGRVDTVRQLIDSGAAVNRRANDGTTALMLAAANGFLDVAQILLVRGADVAVLKDGRTARQVALERSHVNLARLLEEAEALGARLLDAAAEGNDTAVRQLLAFAAPVNITNQRGASALMFAARNGDLGMLQALLSRGADSAARDNQGQNVLDWAQPSPATSRYVTAFLLDRGLSVEAPRRIAPIQSPQVKATLATLAATLSRIPPASPSVRAAERRAAAALARLEALSAKWPAESPDDYRDNLVTDVTALEAALAAGNVDALAVTIESLAEDLEIKLEHCLRSGGTLGGSVVVRVRTVQGGDEIKSWQVFYMPRIFEAAPNPTPDLFPQLSSPTEETLVPGRYVMWVRDPATARLGERTVVKIGEGRKELLLDLPVPVVPQR